jgi:LPPG:FO 2-phospho-L-lactate transferase
MTGPGPQKNKVLALSGGVGGAKLALGLSDVLSPGQLRVLVNTGDDFKHLGLTICPDIDTLLYTLSGLASTTLGWGLEGETWHTMGALERLGGETWFRLGDQDLATHLWRTAQLAAGATLTGVTTALARQLGVTTPVLPMSDDPVQTLVQSDEGDLPFQSYFVRRRCEPAVKGFKFEGIEAARPNPAVMRLLEDRDLKLVVLCPSNPFVSLDPVLQLPGLWRALRTSAATVVAVSPIVGGLAIKGPAAKIMQELGLPVSALGVAEHYQRHYPGLLDCFVIDHADGTLEQAIRDTGMEVAVAQTMMREREDKRSLARSVLQLGRG